MEGPSAPLRTTLPSITVSAPASCCMSSAASSSALARIIDTERIRANLRHHRFDALAERSRPGHDLDHTRGIDRYPHAVERPKPALLDKEGKSRPDAFAASATPPGIVAGIEHDL